MRWDRDHQSRDIIDRRGQRGPSRLGGGGGGGGLGLLLGLALRTRYGWILIVGAVLYYLFVGAGDRGDQAGLAPAQAPAAGAPAAPGDEMARFVGFVLDDVQDTWAAMPDLGVPYQRARLVLFTGTTATACGLGDAATGPFYCPGDQLVYIDLDFYRALRERLGAPGDFAQAYVIAHEIGHHLQNLLGTSEKVQRAGRGHGEDGLSVRLELQADCYAGVWAHSAQARGLLEVGDVDEALTAAAAIGDDTLQRQAGGRVRPETFSHGTSAQRVRWFKTGLDAGRPSACDTFSAERL
ncbi:MAG: neutral zinc metallopeptidase [Myxococcales bacterium]|nr:neutral zinc metallopeptidase [Myxococcales bacterium]